MTYSKLGNIKGPQGRRGINMTGNATPPPAVDESTLEGDLWLDSLTGDVYRASAPDPWKKDGTWNTWGTVLWKVADDVLMVQPADGDTGTTGEPANFGYFRGAPWCSASNNPSVDSMTSVRSKGAIAMNANSRGLFEHCSAFTEIPSAISDWDISGVTSMEAMFAGCTSLTDISPLSGWDIPDGTSIEGMFANCPSLTDISPISGWDISGVTVIADMFFYCTSLTDLSPLSGWDVSGKTSLYDMFGGCKSLTDISPLSGWDISGVTYMTDMFSGCTSLADASILSGWDMSNVTIMDNMFRNCPIERIGVPSLEHGGRFFVSKFEDTGVIPNTVSAMETTMFTNTTTHETMLANQILTDMDTTPSKYSTGTVWTIARA